MKLRRRHLIELHEQPWFPDRWRKMFQEGLGRCLGLLGIYKNVAPPLSRFLYRTRTTSVLDLCSGSAEPIVELHGSLGEPLENPEALRIFISDLFPNLEEFRRLSEEFPQTIDFYPEPVNALNPPKEAPRVRTMLNALHHFRPEEAEDILRDAAENADGFAAVEATGRTWRNMLMTIPLPFLAAVIYLFLLRPFRFQHLLWGFLIPVVPLCAFFDGIVSNFRTYSLEELEAMTRSIAIPDFEWEIGTVDVPRTELKVTYIFGWRTGSRSAEAPALDRSRDVAPSAGNAIPEFA